jgi:hypothetical protein
MQHMVKDHKKKLIGSVKPRKMVFDIGIVHPNNECWSFCFPPTLLIGNYEKLGYWVIAIHVLFWKFNICFYY